MSSSVFDMPEEVRGVQGAWPGGPCPKCGEDMPANLVHCMTCRAMLNSELKDDTIEIPKFVPLPEIKIMKTAKARGHYIRCSGCSEELRVNSKYVGERVSCRHCNHAFVYDESIERVAMYSNCPHCSQEIRASMKFAGQNVSCRFCDGPIKLEA